MKTLLLASVLLASALRADVQILANELRSAPFGTTADTGIVQVLVITTEGKTCTVTVTFRHANGMTQTVSADIETNRMAFVEIGSGTEFVSASARIH